MTQIFNRSSEREKRTILRNNMTTAEQKLWKQIKNRKLFGVKFRRQYSIGPYIVDFFATQHKLAIEVDGAIHLNRESIEYDAFRDEYLKSMGIRVLRFSNEKIEQDIDRTLEMIKLHLK